MTYKAGSPEYVVQQLLSKIQQKDFSGLDKYISKQATGAMKAIRGGKPSERTRTRVTTLLSGARFYKDKAVPFGRYRVVVLASSRGQIVQLRTRRESGGKNYLVYDMVVPRIPVRSNNRNQNGGNRGSYGNRGRSRRRRR